MPQVGFEPKITAFELAKTVHALYRAVNVIGFFNVYHCISLEELLRITHTPPLNNLRINLS
jgi:hypothetical protein